MMPSEILKGLSVTFRSMFRKRTTTQYPEVKKPTSPRFHGRHQLNRYPDGLERCIGCELWITYHSAVTDRLRNTL